MAKIITTLLISPFSTDVQYIEQTLARCIHCKIKLTIEQDISLAYSHLKSQHFDTILVDCGDKTNAQLEPIKTIKTGSENTNLAIIALVEQDTPAIYHQALQAGASDCLPMDQLTPSLLERSILHAIHQKTDETRLLKLANYDALTGLTNRSLFKTRLNQYISQTRRSEQQLALMIINLDNFYRVNEILGQDAGDELLAQAADRLHNCIRETDMVARLSGDEFAVVAAQLHGSDDASTLANGILQACHFAIESETVDITITCSIGVAVFPKDGDNSKRLLIQADTALRQSRDSGGNCFHFADLCLDKLTQQRQQLSADIGHALIRNQL
ncbi:MAG: GGDEF domain-containing protein, partial [Pseudomonadales bacterium]